MGKTGDRRRAVVCTEANLADSVIINTSAVVDHECVVGEAAHICSGCWPAGCRREEAFIGLRR